MSFGRWLLYSCLTLGIAIAGLLSACAPAAFRQDFKGFNSAYGDMLNEQMLLNLARLDNGHPAQFLAIGSIDSRFTFTAGATGGFNSADTHTQTLSGTDTIVGKILTLTGRGLANALSIVTGENASVNAAATSQPEFQWIPLNQEAVAKEVLQPMDPDVFYSLYQQGFPIDELLRVMVERIETTVPGQGVLILVNSPTAGSLESYGRFLRVCEMLRELQSGGALVLESSKVYEPVAEFTRAAPVQKPGGGETEKPETTGTAADPPEGFQPTPEEVMSAEKDGYAWHKISEGVWQLGKYEQEPKFYLKAGGAIEAAKIIENRGIVTDKGAIQRLVMLLENGVSVTTTVREHKVANTCLILRSYDRSLQATAREQEGFGELLKSQDNPDYAAFFANMPASSPQCRPILRTRWDDAKIQLERPLVKLNYSGKTYQITDPAGATALDYSSTWNRDVYRLLIALNSQVTVDISKFQRQILELEQ